MSNRNLPGPASSWCASTAVLLLLATATPGRTGTAQASEDMASACRSLVAITSTPLIDYNDPTMKSRLQIVEEYHFNSDVRSLRKGESSTVAGDLDFVLRNVPNHYDALALMGRWQVQNGPPRSADNGAERAECYYQRAIEFRSTDARLHLIYGIYLHQSKRLADAEREYHRAETMGGDDAELYYNLGLLMIDMGDLTRARGYADKAYQMGYPLPGLRNKLRQQSSH
jgi:Flp pilus assembly protein TadD